MWTEAWPFPRRGRLYLQAMKSGWKGIVLEAGFKGALDELRFWNAALGGEEDDFS